MIVLAPLHVEVSWSNERKDDVFSTNVGLYGRVYHLNFLELMNLICARQGRDQKRLEHRR